MKKTLLFAIFTASFINLAVAQTGWFIQPSFTSQNLYDCKATAVEILTAGSDNGKIFRSTNGGYNWFTYDFHDLTLNTCSFKYVLGMNSDSWSATGTQAAYGFSFGSIDSIYKVTGASPSPTFEALSFLQGYFFYQATVTAGSGGKFYIQDGSNNYIWRPDAAATTKAAGRNINYSWGPFFVGDNGLIMYADSIGLVGQNGEAITWRIIPSGTTKNLNCIMGGNGSPNYIIAGDDGTILLSTDYGMNWTTAQSPTTEDLYGISTRYAYLICGANGTILRSYNNFFKWYKQNTPTTEDLYFNMSLTYSEFIAGGRNGILLRTTDGGGSLKRFISNVTLEGSYNSATNLMVSDTISVTVRSSTSPYNNVVTGKGILTSSGNTLTEIGPAAVNNVPYYIQINHRNSIETWSKTPQTFSNNDMYYDFYPAASRAFGDNQKLVDNSPFIRYGIYGGDVNQDGSIDLTDIITTYNDAINFVSGYVSTDITGDNNVDLSDILIAYNNSLNFISIIRP